MTDRSALLKDISEMIAAGVADDLSSDEIAGNVMVIVDTAELLANSRPVVAPAQCALPGWQPINTAPRDGTEIIGVFYRRYDESDPPTIYGPWTVAFDGKKWRSSWDGQEVVEYMDDFVTQYKGPDIEPTHWQPMPDASQITEDEQRHDLPGHEESMAGLRSLTVRNSEVKSGTVPEREVYWLIERPGPIYTRGPIETHPDWTTDPWRARRFATAKEADNARLSIAVDQYRDTSSVIEHMFINKMPRSLSPVSEGQSASVGDAMEDLRTHRDAWRRALQLASAMAAPAGIDHDDATYWAHELRAFDRTFAALTCAPSSVASTMLLSGARDA